MDSVNHQLHITEAKDFLQALLTTRVDSGVEGKIVQNAEKLKSRRAKEFYMAFGSLTRFVPKDQLNPSKTEKKRAWQIREGWDIATWRLDQTARVFLIISLPSDDQDFYFNTLHQIFQTADMEEMTALYLSFPLLPFPQKFKPLATEGVRTNITNVFDAVSLRNPYPTDYFNENEWNQMILKAAFIDRPLHLIHGLEERTNPELARIISDYAHERWAAQRIVSPEIWRPVVPYVDDSISQDIDKLIQDEDPMQRKAGALVSAQGDFKKSEELLGKVPDLKLSIEKNELTWETLAKE